MPASLVSTPHTWYGVQAPTYPIPSYTGARGLPRVSPVRGLCPKTHECCRHTVCAWCRRAMPRRAHGLVPTPHVQSGCVVPILQRESLFDSLVLLGEQDTRLGHARSMQASSPRQGRPHTLSSTRPRPASPGDGSARPSRPWRETWCVDAWQSAGRGSVCGGQASQ